METFADRLKAAMNEQGLKQVDLVRLAQQKGIKLGKSHVSQYVSGKTSYIFWQMPCRLTLTG